MTDDQVEKLIWREIKKRDITIHDMIGMPGHGIDEHPEDKITGPALRQGNQEQPISEFHGLRQDQGTALRGQV